MIDAVHKTLKGVTKMAAEQRYIALVESWPSYGSTHFVVEVKNMPKMPEECFLAVNPAGILLLDLDYRNVLHSFRFADDAISTWGNSASMFALVISHKGGEKLNFRTEDGAEISALLARYSAAHKAQAQRAQDKLEGKAPGGLAKE